MFSSFLFNRFKHLLFAYENENEYLQHFMSGEVQISIPDAISATEDYIKTLPSLPSSYQIGDNVLFYFNDKYIDGKINGIHFYEGKVKYDVTLIERKLQQVGKNKSPDKSFKTRIYNVDSLCVMKK